MIDVAPQETPGYFPATTVCAAAIRSERLIDLLFSEKHYTQHIKYHEGSKEILGYFQEWKINQGDLGDCKNMLTEPPFNKSSYIFLLEYNKHIVHFHTFVLISETRHIFYIYLLQNRKK